MSSTKTAVEENSNELPVQGKGEELVEGFQEMSLAPAPLKNGLGTEEVPLAREDVRGRGAAILEIFNEWRRKW